MGERRTRKRPCRFDAVLATVAGLIATCLVTMAPTAVSSEPFPQVGFPAGPPPTIATSGVFAPGGSVTLAVSPPSVGPCGSANQVECYHRVGVGPSQGCIYVNHSNPDGAGCTWGSLFQHPRGYRWTDIVPRLFGGDCTGARFDYQYIHGGANGTSAQWPGAGQRALNCTFTIESHMARPDALRGPTWLYVTSQFAICEVVTNGVCSRDRTETGWGVVWLEGDGDPLYMGPDPHCRVERSGPGGRTLTFVGGANNTYGGYDREWTLSDGTTSRNTIVQVTATRPGSFSGTFRTWTNDGRVDRSVTCVAEVEGPELGISMTFPGVPETLPGIPDMRFREGDTLTARVHLTASTGHGALTGVTFDGGVLSVSPADVLTITSAPSPGPFNLSPGETVSFDVELEAAAAGAFTLRSTASATDSSGAAVGPATVERSGRVGDPPIEVSLSTDPEVIKMETREEVGPDGEVELVTDPVDITLAVKATNLLDETVDHVEFPADISFFQTDDYVGAGRIRVIAGPCLDAAPCRPYEEGGLADVQTQGGPLTPAGTGGDSATARYTVRIDKPGSWEARALVMTVDPVAGTNIGVTGRMPIVVEGDGDLVLHIDAPASSLVKAGDFTSITGRLENRSVDESYTIAPLLPEITGNLSGGGLLEHSVAFLPPDECCDIPFNGIIEPGQTVYLSGRLVAMPDNGTRATVEYDLVAYDEDEERVPADEMSVRGGPFTVSIDDSTPPTPDLDYLEAFAGFSAGAGAAVVEFVWGPVQFAAWAVKGALYDLPKAVISSTIYFWEFWRSATPEEKAEFIAKVADHVEAALDPVTYRNAFEAGRAAVNAMVEAEFTAFYEAVDRGDWLEAYRMIGRVAGEIALEVVTSGMFAVAKAKDAQQVVRLADQFHQNRVAETIVKLADDIKNLRVGSKLSNVQLEAFGITDEMAVALRKFAQENRLVLTFRRRNPDSLRWLDQGAIQKPQDLKMKTVNDIDEMYLGYPDKGALVLMEPPRNIDAIVAGIADPLEARAVKARWTKRMDEWVEFTSPTRKRKALDADGTVRKNADGTTVWEDVLDANGNPQLNPTDYFRWNETGEMPWPGRPDGQRLALDYEANPVGVTNVAGRNGFGLNQRTSPDGRVYWEVLAEDQRLAHLPPEQRLRRVTGDLDGMDFRNADGTVLSDDMLIKVWEGLNEISGLDHGETVSWVKDKTTLFAFKEEILRAHSTGPNGDPLIQFGADGHARNVLIDPIVSVFDTTPNSRLHYVRFHGGYTNPRFAATIYRPVVFKAVLRFGYMILPIGWLGRIGCAAFQYDVSPDTPIVRYQDGVLQVWTLEGGWATAPPTTSCSSGDDGSTVRVARASGGGDAGGAVGSDGVLRIRPTVDLMSSASAGTKRLDIRDLPSTGEPGLFPAGSDWFAPGQQVVVNPGGDTQEIVTVVGFGSLLLAEPLRYDHDPGEIVAVLSTPSGPGPVGPVVPPPSRPEPHPGEAGPSPALPGEGTSPDPEPDPAPGGGGGSAPGDPGEPGATGPGAGDPRPVGPGEATGSDGAVEFDPDRGSAPAGSGGAEPLARTGSPIDPWTALLMALGLMGAGLATIGVGRRLRLTWDRGRSQPDR